MVKMKELTLKKDEEQFLFRYETGREEDLLDSLVDMANDRDNNFDWFDAAVLSFQLSKRLVEEADHLLCPQDHASNSDNSVSPGGGYFSVGENS